MAGLGPGRRAAARQINYALIVQLASQFQRYCRDLHGLCADAVLTSAEPSYQPMLRQALTSARKLDRQNANSGNLGHDFGLFGFRFWAAVDALGPQYPARRRRLDQVNTWRNAIAHQDLDRLAGDPLVAGTRPDLPMFRVWRRSLDQLAGGIDRAMCTEVADITGDWPW
ncbi:MAG TPA: hypothetical protein VF109_09565 [Mycobacteriales bacterium]